MHTRSHIVLLTKTPSQAQTVQQLKFDTLLQYLTNALTLFADLGTTANSISGALPYKAFFGGGGTTTS